ncbi:hypothetical protein RIVM261_067490 [Rivularia sp. IAM M-261]|nr:hypothetical protein CAL7716_043470 [Calothrix sp. PCC 7716]GJD21793.1 hypothetical protein RIVM261_067490 [Rivularia sp. IAM M-261]
MGREVTSVKKSSPWLLDILKNTKSYIKESFDSKQKNKVDNINQLFSLLESMYSYQRNPT